MQKFEYRAPRYRVEIPVELRGSDVRLAGYCREISSHGMLVEFCGPVAPNTGGIISFTYKTLALELRVGLARSRKRICGFRFLFESEQDREAVERLVAMLASPKDLAGPVLVR